MRRLVPVLVAVLALLAAGVASATTLAGRFPGLAAEVDARLALIPATHPSKIEKQQKAALTKAATALAVDTADFAKQIALAKKAVGALDRVFPADATIDPLAIAVVDGLAGDASIRNGKLFRSIQVLSAGKAQTRAQAKNDAAAALLGEAQTVTPRTAQLSKIAAALTAMVAGEKIVRKATGSPGVGVTVSGIDVDIDSPANHLHIPSATPPFGTLLVEYHSHASSMTITAIGALGGMGGTPVSFIVVVNGTGLGAHVVPVGGAAVYNSPTVPGATVTAGTMNFTTWDPANQKVGGTFDLTYSNGTATVHLTGTFSTISLQVI